MIKNIISSSFDKLEFEPIQHVYTLDGINMKAVSKVIDQFEEEFSDNIAVRYAEKNKLHVEDVRAMWKHEGDIACDFGHETHDYGERYYYDKTIQPINNHQLAIVNFWSDIPDYIKPIACETRVYTLTYRYAGTFDLLLYDELQKGYIIVDYKTNKDLFKNFRGKTMLTPFDFLLDNPFNHYQIQLSLYQIPLEEIGINVIDRWIIWLKNDSTYRKFETYNYTDYLRNNLKVA